MALFIRKNYLLLSLFFIAFLVRIWRVDQILQFHFDQGRDATVIWNLLHEGKLFLIGPTTGIEGIFRGPLYYYLIAPFYFLSSGNPVLPAIFLAFLSTVAIYIMYLIGNKISGRVTGVIAAILGTFSFTIIYASRWLSNPTPMLFLSVVLVWLMIEIVVAKKRSQRTDLYWIAIAGVVGLSQFHFGSSGEFFYFFALAIFAFWQRAKLPKLKGLAMSAAVLLITALPLILFDMRHNGILSSNIKGFFGGEDLVKQTLGEVLAKRQELYYKVFGSLLFPRLDARVHMWLLGLVGATVFILPKLVKNSGVKAILLLLSAPIIGFVFFQGNYGNIYEYYFTGYFLVFLLLVACILGALWKSLTGRMFVIAFTTVFFALNWEVTRGFIGTKVDNDQVIIFQNQRQAIEWIYADAQGREFNVDVYVPPVIPHSYEYLFTWYDSKPEYEGLEKDAQIKLLYTLYEVDPPHPERLEAWFARQDGIGEVLYETKIGGIGVQKRSRL